jgi:MFS superfamily sulfate permease-like transporter
MEDFISTVVGRGKREICIGVAIGVVLAMLACVFIGFGVCQARSIMDGRKQVQEIQQLKRQVASTQPKINEAIEIGRHIESVFYDSKRVKEDISRELAASGLVVLQIGVSEPTVDRRKKTSNTITNGQVLKVDVSGTMALEDVDGFLKYISARPKVWRVNKLNIAPKISPTNLISTLDKYYKQRDYERMQQFLSQVQDLNLTSIPVEVNLQITVLSKAG